MPESVNKYNGGMYGMNISDWEDTEISNEKWQQKWYFFYLLIVVIALDVAIANIFVLSIHFLVIPWICYHFDVVWQHACWKKLKLKPNL